MELLPGLEGSYVTSDQVIAITIKDDLVQVSSCADLIGDQTVPTSVLGTDYVVTRGFLQPNDNIYVLAIADGTAVYQDGNATPITTLSKGQSFTINLSNDNTFIHASQKIYVYQLTGNGCESGSAIIPKLNCTGSTSVNIVRSNSDMCAVMITTKSGNQNNFTVNGNSTLITGANFSPVPGTAGAYVSARIDLTGSIPVGTPTNVSNSTGTFSLGFINGGTNDGTVYGFFSNFKSSNVQTSQLQVCQGASTQLTAFGGVTYQWSPVAGLSNPNIANPIASPALTTNYKVIITTADGCIDSAFVNVKVFSVKQVDTTVSICSGDSYKLPSGKLVNSAGTFNDIVYYASGCDSLETTVHLNLTGATLSLGIAASQNNICAGTPVTFTATEANGGTDPKYQWLVNGNSAGTNSAAFTSSTFADGDVVSCVMTSGAGCGTPKDITSNSITMAVLPSPEVDAGGDKTINQGNSVTLTATASGNITDITWSPSTGLDNNKILNPKASPTSTIIYTITVQTTDGCAGTGSVTVNVHEDITIPNTFTPNGDGINDKWDIKNLKDFQDCSVHIFDRWGTEVFSSRGYYDAWDGTTKGRRLPFGTYYYVINLNNGARPLSGYVVIIR